MSGPLYMNNTSPHMWTITQIHTGINLKNLFCHKSINNLLPCSIAACIGQTQGHKLACNPASVSATEYLEFIATHKTLD